MANKAKSAWQILVVAIWINFSETIRWVLYSKPRFDVFYQSMGLKLPNTPVNGILWMLWGVVMAVMVFVLARKFSLLHTTVLSWLVVFVMHWIALWNYAILPIGILWVVVPLSLLEIVVAAWISVKLQGLGAVRRG